MNLCDGWSLFGLGRGKTCKQFSCKIIGALRGGRAWPSERKSGSVINPAHADCHPPRIRCQEQGHAKGRLKQQHYKIETSVAQVCGNQNLHT